MTFDDYVHTRGGELLRHATIVTADRHIAEDVVQSVLERAYPRWDQISVLEFPDAYLRRMVINEFISLRRRISRIVLTDRTPEPEQLVDHAQQHADRDALIAEIRKLPNRQRAAVGLRYWQGLTDAEIAEQLGCGEGTARGYIWRALRTLRLGSAESGLLAPLTTELEAR